MSGLLVLVISFFLLSTVYCLLSTSSLAQGSLPLQVAPVRRELTIDPGQTEVTSVKFFNLTDKPLTGNIKVVDFVVDNIQGQPRLLDDPKKGGSKYSAANWINTPYDEITIAPNNLVNIPLTINVPKNVLAGGRYAAVYFQTSGQEAKTNAPAAETGSAILHRIVALIYIRIPGEVSESALVTRLYASPFQEYGPVEVESQIANRGNYHITPQGTIKMTDSWGNLVDQVAIKDRNVFPESVLEYKNNLGKKWLIGRFKISLDASYGQKGQVLSQSIYVLVFPWRLLSVIILSFLIIFIVWKKTVTDSKKEVDVLEHKLESEKEEINRLKEMLNSKKE